jgi:hypothetical protein
MGLNAVMPKIRVKVDAVATTTKELKQVGNSLEMQKNFANLPAVTYGIF